MKTLPRSLRIPSTFPLAALLSAALLGASPAAASTTDSDWPHWRGPRWNGTSTESGLPTTWGEGPDGRSNVRWSLDLPGAAGSTPVVAGDRIFLTSAVAGSDRLRVLAVSRDGKVLWTAGPGEATVEVFAQLAHETNAAAPSPVTDGEHVWALFASARLYRFGVDGDLGPTVDLAERYGAPSLFFGLSTSPLLVDGKIVVQLLHAESQRVVALDATTGEEVWAHERPTDAQKESLHSYTSVIPFGTDAGRLLLVHGADYLTAHDPASGVERWRFGPVNPKDSYNPTYRLVATPVVAGDLVVVPTAKRGPVFGLRPAGTEEGAFGPDSPSVAWTHPRGTPDVPSPIAVDGRIVLAGENGRLTLLDAGKGEELAAERLHQSTYRASPVVADGKIYVAATDGTVTVLRADTPTVEILATNDLGAGRLASSPAIAHGTIYLRTAEALFAIAEGAGGKQASETAATTSSR